MATNNSVNSPLAGTTGTGNFVGSTSPTLVTPTIGAATATSLAFSPTTGGLIGTTAADNAGAGKVGEVITSNVALASAVSLSNNTNKDVTSISLTAGDWDVTGNIFLNASSQVMTAGLVWCNTASITKPDASLYNGFLATTTTLGQHAASTPLLRVNVSGNTTVYLSTVAAFASGTVTACGTIFARRVR